MTARVDDAMVAQLYGSGLSQAAVAADMGINVATVIKSMRRSGAPRRSHRESRARPLVPLSEMEAEVLSGLMLGDGCLTLGPKSTNATLSITRTSRDLAYLRWTATVFAARVAPRGVATRDVHDARTGKTYRSSVLRTSADPALTRERARWYPDGHKIVPPDLSLTPLAVAVWLADDGSVRAASRRSPDVKFATHSFSAGEVENLSSLLKDRYGRSVHVYQEAAVDQRTIRLFGESARALLRDADPVFPPLPRKSDRWRKSELLDVKTPARECPRCSCDRVYRWAKTSKGVQKFKCQSCMRVFRDEYERAWRDPRTSMGEVT